MHAASPRPNDPGHPTPQQARDLAHRVLDLILDYHQSLPQRPILPDTKPGDVLNALPDRPPQQGFARGEGSWDDLFHDLQTTIIPALTHWQTPGFFGYFPCNFSWPAFLGDMLSTGLGVQGMLWQTSPACTELETRVLDWMAHALGLPERFLASATGPDGAPSGGGVIQGTASEATLVAMVAARHRLRARQPDADPASLVAYCSTQAHSSVLKATRIAGVEHLRTIATDASGALDPHALADACREDQARALRPFYFCATAGTTASGALDPTARIAAVRDQLAPDAWLHVDAAWAGVAAVCPEHRAVLDGVGHADSLCTNPHKWLLTCFDCDLFWTADRQSLTDALRVTPEYLRNPASDTNAVIDYRDWQTPLGRRFRALKLWLVMRHYGIEGLRAHIRRHVDIAADVERRIRDDPRFELAAPRSLSLICFRCARAPGESHHDADQRSRALLERANATGGLYLTHATLPDRQDPTRDRYAIRMAIGATTTEHHHALDAWRTIADLADAR